MMRKIASILMMGGIISSLFLIYFETRTGSFCPRIFNFPACFLVLIAFVLVFISEIFTHSSKKLSYFFFFSGNLLGLGLGAWFSIHKLFLNGHCPVFFQIPLCFVSFLIFLYLLIWKLKKWFKFSLLYLR